MDKRTVYQNPSDQQQLPKPVKVIRGDVLASIMNTKIQIDTAEMAKYVELADIVPAKKDLLSVISEAHAAQMSLGSDTHMVATMPDAANPAHKEPCDRAYDSIVTDLKLMKSDSTQVAQILSSFHHYTRPFVPVMMCTDGKPLKVIGGGAENLLRGLHVVLAGAFWEIMLHDAAVEVSKSSMSKVRAAATDARPLTQEYVKAFRGAVARDEAGPPANPVSTTCIDSIQWKALLKAQGAIRLAVTGTTTGSLAEEPEELDRQVVRYKAQISAQGWSARSAVSTRLFWDLMTGAQQELVSGCAVYDVVINERWLLNGCSTEPMASHTGFVGALIEAYGGPVSGIYLNDAAAVALKNYWPLYKGCIKSFNGCPTARLRSGTRPTRNCLRCESWRVCPRTIVTTPPSPAACPRPPSPRGPGLSCRPTPGIWTYGSGPAMLAAPVNQLCYLSRKLWPPPWRHSSRACPT